MATELSRDTLLWELWAPAGEGRRDVCGSADVPPMVESDIGSD